MRVALNLTAELVAAGDDATTPMRFTLDGYMRQAFSHRFCLVSQYARRHMCHREACRAPTRCWDIVFCLPAACTLVPFISPLAATHALVRLRLVTRSGDDVTTHKLAESIAIAALGGCLPLIIHSAPHAVHLPFPRHINYCKVAYILNATSHGEPEMSMSRLLDRLATVTEEEYAKRRQAAVALHPAFVAREGSTLAEPSAAHYIIAAMCARAARARDPAAGCERQRGEVAEAEAAVDPVHGRTPPTCLP